MDSFRGPFQFRTSDLASRQAELQKKFGLPNREKKNMTVDFPSGVLGADPLIRSPRLQHRVPLFQSFGWDSDEGSMSNSIDESGHKQKVRVIPIELEDGTYTKRHRNVSGPPSTQCAEEEASPVHEIPVQSEQNINKPRIRTIPIQVEDRSPVAPSNEDHAQRMKAKDVKPKPLSRKTVGKVPHVDSSKVKPGCNVSKDNAKPKEPVLSIPLRQVQAVLKKLEGYEAEVENFSGTAKDKQYRYLDEMLTRCMLDLDDVDVMGKEEYRAARKAAIRRVQQCIDSLEAKVGNSQMSAEDPQSSQESDVQMECDEVTTTETSVNEQAESEHGSAMEAVVGESTPDVQSPPVQAVPVTQTTPAEVQESTEGVCQVEELPTSSQELPTPQIGDGGSVVVEEPDSIEETLTEVLNESFSAECEDVTAMPAEQSDSSGDNLCMHSQEQVIIEEVADSPNQGTKTTDCEKQAGTTVLVEEVNDYDVQEEVVVSNEDPVVEMDIETGKDELGEKIDVSTASDSGCSDRVKLIGTVWTN